MAVNKVVYGSDTLIDLTADTAMAADVKVGKTFHSAAGESIIGVNSESGAAATLFDVELITDTEEDYSLDISYQDAQRIIDVMPEASTTSNGLMSSTDKGLLDSLSQTFYWTPKIYDNNTYLFDAPQQEYFKLGKLKVISVRFQMPKAYSIASMLQIRNLPCNVVLGGNCYIAADTGKGYTVQGITGSAIYPRPNWTGSLPINAWVTACVIAY